MKQRFVRSTLVLGTLLPSVVLAFSSALIAQEPIRVELTERKVQPAPKVDERPRFASDEMLVRFVGGQLPGEDQVESFVSEFGLSYISHNPWIAVHRYRLPEGVAVADALRQMKADSRVDYVEPNYICYLSVVPNDTFYANFSGVANDLQRWGFNGVGADRNLNAETAWDETTGRTDVVIAVADTGVDLDHPDLVGNIWTNPGEIPGNGVDDDGNGFIDDVNGWDFFFNNNDPNPDLGDGIDNDGNGAADDNTFHGTFSASCAAARGNDGNGAVGAAWNCKIMALQIFAADGGAFVSDIANSITYAGNNGADVLNMSFGGPFSGTVQSAVNFTHGQGVVQVASAGNSNSSSQEFPASLNFVISVGASDSASVLGGGSGDIDGRSSFSQFGPAAVDVVAPGTDLIGAAVLSVADGNPGAATWFIASGTSFSGPTVAGLAALIISKGLDIGAGLNNDDVENIVQTTAVDMPDDPGDSPNGGSTWDSFGRVDFQAALDAVVVGGANNPPVADAGPDQSADTNISITFDGTGSSDPDLDPLTFSWDFGDGSPDGSGAMVNHSYAVAGSYTVTLTVDDGTDIDMDTAVATISDPPVGGGQILYWSSTGTRDYPGGVSAANEDIVQFDTSTGIFSLYFDGSDVGLGSAQLSGFVLLAGGDILFTLTASFSISGMVGGPGGSTTADDSDMVLFTPSSLGPNTSGVMTFFFDGSDVSLTSGGEDVDAITVRNGNLVVSTVGSFSGSGASGADEDLFEFVATSFGSATAGSFVRIFDGSDVGMGGNGSEDIRALHISPADLFYFSTVGNFSVNGGVTGADEDILLFTPTTLGNSTSGTFSIFQDSSTIGVPTSADFMGFFILE